MDRVQGVPDAAAGRPQQTGDGGVGGGWDDLLDMGWDEEGTDPVADGHADGARDGGKAASTPSSGRGAGVDEGGARGAEAEQPLGLVNVSSATVPPPVLRVTPSGAPAGTSVSGGNVSPSLPAMPGVAAAEAPTAAGSSSAVGSGAVPSSSDHTAASHARARAELLGAGPTSAADAAMEPVVAARASTAALVRTRQLLAAELERMSQVHSLLAADAVALHATEMEQRAYADDISDGRMYVSVVKARDRRDRWLVRAAFLAFVVSALYIIIKRFIWCACRYRLPV